MAVKHIYLVRHGETADNRHWIHQSNTVPLSEKGKSEAEALVSAFADVPLDSVIASDAVRAMETARPTASAHALHPVPDSLLRELHRGVMLEGSHHLSLVSIEGSLLLFLRAGNRSWHFGNGENVLEFRDRIERILKLLSELQGDHVLVVAHRGVINGLRYALKHGLQGSPHRFVLSAVFGKTANASITELTYDTERANPWKVERENDVRHLRGI